jgi:hypothetical protein
MTPESAKQEMEKRFTQSGVAMSALTPEQGIRLMLDFYRDVRAEKCELAADGDMLLFQWGTYDWDGGRSFQFDITRQFIVSHSDDEDDDDAISQLSLKFHFTPSTESDAIESSNHWCSTPDESPDFETFIFDSDAYRAVQDLRPSKVTLDYDLAG